MKRMVTVLWGQRFFVHNHYHNFAKLRHFHAAFLQQFYLFAESNSLAQTGHLAVV